jgi:hypothetical protein
MSPAVAFGLERRPWDIGDIVKLIEEWDADEPQVALVCVPVRFRVVASLLAGLGGRLWAMGLMWLRRFLEALYSH